MRLITGSKHLITDWSGYEKKEITCQHQQEPRIDHSWSPGARPELSIGTQILRTAPLKLLTKCQQIVAFCVG
jgi:hypothetical protein